MSSPRRNDWELPALMVVGILMLGGVRQVYVAQKAEKARKVRGLAYDVSLKYVREALPPADRAAAAFPPFDDTQVKEQEDQLYRVSGTATLRAGKRVGFVARMRDNGGGIWLARSVEVTPAPPASSTPSVSAAPPSPVRK